MKRGMLFHARVRKRSEGEIHASNDKNQDELVVPGKHKASYYSPWVKGVHKMLRWVGR